MNHKGSINLETQRLILKKLKVEDAEEVFKNWTSDEQVSKFVRWSTHKSVEDTKQWLLEEEKNCVNNNYYTWGIILKETREFIGSISAVFRQDFDGRYEIGYAIGKKYWNNGYTTEALRCVMDYLINEIGIRSFICSHAKQNPASGVVMQKVGFKYVKDACFEKFDKTQKFDCKVYYLDVN